MTLKNRLAQLEKHRQPARQATDIETMRASIIAKLDAAMNGEVLPVYPMTPERAEIAARLQRIADQAKP